MYEVSKHAHGRPVVRWGPMSGCRDFSRHKWLTIAKVRAKQAAIDLANAEPAHCVVVIANTSNKIFDNGKPPADLNLNAVRDEYIPRKVRLTH